MDKRTWIIIAICSLAVGILVGVRTCNATQEDFYAETTATVQTVSSAKPEQVKPASYTAVDKGEASKTFSYETDYFNIIFDTNGASIRSMMLKKHANADGQLVDIVFKGDNDNNAFLLYWGDDVKSPVKDAFSYKIDGKKVIFRKTFMKNDGSTFDVVKTFEFRDSDYLFAVDVDIDGADLEKGDYAYTLAYEPQVGPEFGSMKNNNYDYRKVYLGLPKDNGKVKRSQAKLANSDFWITRTLNWFSLTSKYFTVIAVPQDNSINYKYRTLRSSGDISQTDGLYISVPYSAGDNQTIYWYCGPQLKSALGSYYSGSDNEWGLKNLNLDDAMESGSILGWLETILKWCLTMLNKVIPNFGVDIIVLTLILKLLLLPLNKKTAQSTAKMNAIQPQVKAIQEKYPDNPQKQNMAMSELYKENGISMMGMGGCLPLLIQFPVLIAFYGLLNKHIELRGAMFIPGWISDLSMPETIATLSFNIPLLGNQIHLLPIIYTASMIFSMRFTQSSSQTSTKNNSTMWMLTYGMPIMFFFVLYSAPSGLILYWTVSNLLSIVQQIFTNKKVSSGAWGVKVADENSSKKEPAAVLKYQEKLKKLEQDQNDKKKGKK